MLIALSSPFVVLMAYQSSRHIARYEPRLVALNSDPSSLLFTKPVEIEQLGIVHFPSSLTEAEIDAYVKGHFTVAVNPAIFRPRLDELTTAEFAKRIRQKYPDFRELGDIQLAKQVLLQYPEYRGKVAFHEYELVPQFENRPFWAAGVSLVTLIVLVVIVQGGISVLSWVLRGFRQP